MSLWNDIVNDAKDALKNSLDSARSAINDNINANINAAIGNTSRAGILRSAQGFYSGVEAYGMLKRAQLKNLNTYQNGMYNSYAIPVTVSDDTTTSLKLVQQPPRYEIRSVLYADEYDDVVKEFDEQTGEGSTITVDDK